MAKVAVVFHSGYGHTQRLAQSVAQGAGAELLSIDADGVADGLVLAPGRHRRDGAELAFAGLPRISQ